MSWAAVIIGGSAIIGGGISALGAMDAADTQAEAAMSSQELQMRFLREVRSDIADAVEAGLVDLDTGFNTAIAELQPLTSLKELNAARQLLEDPDAIMDRPSTQFQFGQGVEALQAAFSRTSGGGASGTGFQAATEYGQNFASQALDAELARLIPFINIGVGAKTNIANLLQGKGISKANLRISGATGSGQITGQMMPSVAQSIMAGGEAKASGSINMANIGGNLASQLGLLGAYKFSNPPPQTTKYPDMFGSPY